MASAVASLASPPAMGVQWCWFSIVCFFAMQVYLLVYHALASALLLPWPGFAEADQVSQTAVVWQFSSTLGTGHGWIYELSR